VVWTDVCLGLVCASVEGVLVGVQACEDQTQKVHG
jgi:hypothetical protein